MYTDGTKFQPTYLYKIRPWPFKLNPSNSGFNPRTSIRYDSSVWIVGRHVAGFNPRTSIRYDGHSSIHFPRKISFNPRTSIRYDTSCCQSQSLTWRFNPRTSIRYDRITNNTNIYSLLPISLCDNKLFGFFIDEIEPIDMCNRLIINKCENPGFWGNA